MTPRQLPHDDPAVARLDPAARAAMARHWQRRACSEGQVAHAFAELHAALDPHADPVVAAMLARAVTDEQRHSDVCHDLATTYAGAPLPRLATTITPLPDFPDDPEPVARTLRIAGLCCLSETLATVWLEASLTASRTPLARAANRVHLGEEIDHARAGWAWLAAPTRTPDELAALERHLLSFLRAGVHAWLTAGDDLPVGTGLADHGILAPAQHRAAILRGARDVVLPGFAHLGLDTAAPRRWLATLA